MSKLNVQNLQNFLGWLFPLDVSNFLWKNSSFSYYKDNNNFICPRFLYVCFSQKKTRKMHLKCRVLKIKVEWSNQNKRLANTFDRNFDQTRNESLVLRAVRHVQRAFNYFKCNSKHRRNVKLKIYILCHQSITRLPL